MKNQVLSGLGVAMITPFNAAGTIDWAATERLVNHLLDGKADFLVVLGTTGETPTLTADEQHEYVRRVIAQVAHSFRCAELQQTEPRVYISAFCRRSTCSEVSHFAL